MTTFRDFLEGELPWLRIERVIRAILAVRFERGARDDVDRALMTVIQTRERVERAGWFN